MGDGEWSAILPSSVDRYREALAILSQQIRGICSLRGDSINSLSSGPAGALVYFGYLHGSGFDPDAEDTFAELLHRALHSPSRTALSGIHHGLTGQLWAVNHLVDDSIEEVATFLSEMDSQLDGLVRDVTQVRELGFANGVAGMGYYGLTRLPDERGAAIARAALERLEHEAERDADGTRWLTPPQVLPDWQRMRYPKGVYDMGLAHGMPGILNFCARCVAMDVEVDRARALFDDGWRWFYAQRRDERMGAYFPARILSSGGAEPGRQRTAWCSGDLGLGAALVACGQAVSRDDVIDCGVSLARAAVRDDIPSWGLEDLSFCHGYAGCAHILNRLYQSTADETFLASARRCFEIVVNRVLDAGQMRKAVRFTPTPMPENGKRLNWISSDPGLVQGAAGVGAALLGALSDDEPFWDEVFLVDMS